MRRCWETAGRLRVPAVGAGKRPFLIAVTGCGSAADRDRAAEVGFDLFLLKPVDPAVLVGILDRFQRVIARPEWGVHARAAVTTVGNS